MELRLMKSETERRIFGQRMDEARARHGVGFKETSRSALGRVHMAFGELYALFEKENEPIERAMSGFAMHDLETFPQSYPKPDLTHYPAWSVIECGELWSFSKGAGNPGAAWRGDYRRPSDGASDARLSNRKAVGRHDLLHPDPFHQTLRAGGISLRCFDHR